MCVYAHAHVYTGAPETRDVPLHLELQAIVGCLTWVLPTKPVLYKNFMHH